MVDKDTKVSTILAWVLVVLLVMGFVLFIKNKQKITSLNEEIEYTQSGGQENIGELEEQVESLEAELEDSRDSISEYQNALNRANSNIEDINSMVQEAQSSAWETYEEMGEALENLQETDTVPAP